MQGIEVITMVAFRSQGVKRGRRSKVLYTIWNKEEEDKVRNQREEKRMGSSRKGGRGVL